jgi:hypothetical protein
MRLVDEDTHTLPQAPPPNGSYTATSEFSPRVFDMGTSSAGMVFGGYSGVPVADKEAMSRQFEPMFAGRTDWCQSGYNDDVVDDADYSRVRCFSLFAGVSADGIEGRRIGFRICRICLISHMQMTIRLRARVMVL